VNLWAREVKSLRAAATVEERAQVEGRLDVAFKKLVPAVLSDEQGWDQYDHRAWKYLQELDEGDAEGA
jgi:hypothetical protein